MEKREPLYTVGGNVNWYSHCGKVSQFLNKLKIELPHDPTIPPLGIYMKKIKLLTGKDMCIYIFIMASFVIAKLQKKIRCPSMEEWIKKLQYRHIVFQP